MANVKRLTREGLRRLIMTEVRRSKKASEIPYEEARAAMEAGGLSVEEIDDALDELADVLGAARADEDIQFGEGRTPHGKRVMAGAANTGVVTHFWDDDDGWQEMPESFELVSSYMS